MEDTEILLETEIEELVDTETLLDTIEQGDTETLLDPKEFLYQPTLLSLFLIKFLYLP